jgi:hypothetical protein
MRKAPFQRGSHPRLRASLRRARRRRSRWHGARTGQRQPHTTHHQPVSVSMRVMHRRAANPARPPYPLMDRTQLLRRLNPRARRQLRRRRPHVLRMHIRQSADRSRRRRIRTYATPGRMRTEPRGTGPSGKLRCRAVRAPVQNTRSPALGLATVKVRRARLIGSWRERPPLC